MLCTLPLIALGSTLSLRGGASSDISFESNGKSGTMSLSCADSTPKVGYFNMSKVADDHPVRAWLIDVPLSCLGKAPDQLCADDAHIYPPSVYCKWHVPETEKELVFGPMYAHAYIQTAPGTEMVLASGAYVDCPSPKEDGFRNLTEWSEDKQKAGHFDSNDYTAKLSVYRASDAIAYVGPEGSDSISLGTPHYGDLSPKPPPPSAPPPPPPKVLAQTADAAESDCYAIKTKLASSPTGVYWVTDKNGNNPKQVMCEMETDGGGWTMMTMLRASSQWDWTPTRDEGSFPNNNSGWDRGATLVGLNQNLNERIVVYLKIIKQGQDLGTNWLKVKANSGTLPYSNIQSPDALRWTMTDNFGYSSASGTTCSHGCTKYRGYGMFKSGTWHGTQGGNNGCRDGNNICWMSQGLGCNVGSARCAYLTGAGEGVWYGYRLKQ